MAWARVIQGVEWMMIRSRPTTACRVHAPRHERPARAAALTRRVDTEHAEAGRGRVVELGVGAVGAHDEGDAPHHGPVLVDRDEGAVGPGGDVGQLPFVAGLLHVAWQRPVRLDHDLPGPLALLWLHFAYKHETSCSRPPATTCSPRHAPGVGQGSSLKWGFSITPTIEPPGSVTAAVRMPSPTSATASRSTAPAASSRATAASASSTPQ